MDTKHIIHFILGMHVHSYSYFINDEIDIEKYRLVKEFNSFDLYSKGCKLEITDIKKYYA